MSAVLRAEALGRWYGEVVGLNELTLELPPGVTGLIGPNGAGKSTLLKLIAGEIRPSRGRLLVLGEDPFANRDLATRMGFCPQLDALYDDMSAFQFVRFFMRLAGYDRRAAGELARTALDRVGLGESRDRRLGTYSKGMRQRAKLAQAIAHEPELLVLDEPLTGLDPLGRRDLLALLRQLADAGTSILISSHVLHEVEHLTSEIVLLHRGRLLARGALDGIRALLSQHPHRVELRAARPRELARSLIEGEEVLSVRLGQDDGLVSVETRDVERFHARLTALAASGAFGVRQLESVDSSLEAVFDYLVS